MSNTLFPYLVLSLFLLCMGIAGLIMRRNLIVMLISLELMLTGAILNILSINTFLNPGSTIGEVLSIFVIALAAAESAIALALIYNVFKHYAEISSDKLDKLEG